MEALQWQLRALEVHEDASVLMVVWKGGGAWLGGWAVGLVGAADVLGPGLQPASGDVALFSWTSSSLKTAVPCL